MFTVPASSKILLVVWEGADWRMLHPLLDAGHMPNLNRLVDRGVMAEPAQAQSSQALAAGQPGENPAADPRFRPVWQELAEHGRRCIVVRWPGSHPATMLPNGGIVVSDQFRTESLPLNPAAEGSVEPTRLRETLERLRVHSSDLGQEDIRGFVPDLDKLKPEEGQPVQWLTGALADAATTNNLAVHLLSTEPWDFAVVPYTALSAICSQFLQFARVEIAENSPFRQVSVTSWVLADQILGRLLGIAGEDATVFVVSTQGVLGTPVTVIAGPGVKEDERLDVSGGPASALDLVPTFRWLAGLPDDDKFSGKPWKQAWK